MASNEIIKRKREEYEMQLFGFHSSIVYATLKSMIEEQMRKRLSKLFDFLEQKSKPTGHDAERLLRDKRKLTKAYYQSIRDHLPAIENCINKVVNIPQHVLLEEDVVQSTQYTKEEFIDADNKLKELQLKLKQAVMLNGALKDELDAANNFEDGIEVANTLCNIVQTGSKYPEVSRDLVKLMEHYQDLIQCEIVRNEPDLIHKNVCRKHLPVDVDPSLLEFD